MTIFPLLLLMFMTGCYTTVWQARSPEEIKAFSVEIHPLPDSVLTIPEFNGASPKPIIKLSSIGMLSTSEYVIYNNGDLFYNGEFYKKITRTDIENLINELNNKGLFGVEGKKIREKIIYERRACLFNLFFLSGPHPGAVLDGGTNIIQVALNDFEYYISYYAVWYDAAQFPTCQDIQILNESIIFLHSKFKEFEEN